MQILTLFLVALVALEHIGIAGLEMFAKPEKQAELFDMPLEFIKNKHAKMALANQGIYNGLLENYLAVNDWSNYEKFHARFLETQLKVKESERKSINNLINEGYKTQNKNKGKCLYTEVY